MAIELERLEALHRRINYLEDMYRSLHSVVLEQEATISELKEMMDAHLKNHS
jgi:uncharacterized coiled-coil protein SlyX